MDLDSDEGEGDEVRPLVPDSVVFEAETDQWREEW